MKAEETPGTDGSEIRAAMAAMERAAESARDTAIRTDTAIIIVQNGKRVRVTAEKLRQERASQAS